MNNSLLRLHITFFLLFVLQLSFSQRFSSDYWHDGTLYLKRGDSLKVPLRYDLANSVVYTKKDDKVKTWSTPQIDYFKFTDARTKQDRFFKALEVEKEDGFKIPVLFELVYQGKYSLLRRELVLTQSVGYNPSVGVYIPVNARVESFNHYALSPKGTIKWFEPTRKSMTQLFSKRQELVKNYIKENKIKFRTTEDIIKVFKFYNSL